MPDWLYWYVLDTMAYWRANPKQFYLVLMIALFFLLVDGVDRWRNGAR